MKRINSTAERSTLIIAILALAIIGISLLASTWQAITHLSEAEEEHLRLSTRAVLLAVESSLRRTPMRDGADRLSSHTAEFFSDMEEDGSVLFVGILTPGGGKLLTTSQHTGGEITLPKSMTETLFEQGAWHGRLEIDGTLTYVSARRIAPSRMRHLGFATGENAPIFLVVGIDLEKHLEAYKGFRRNALFQALYLLAGALFIWGLTVSFFSRREQATKAAKLEDFQATLLDNLPDGLITLEARQGETVICSVNPAALAILECASADLLGKPITALPEPVAGCVLDRATFQCPACWQKVRTPNAQLEVRTLPLEAGAEGDYMMIIRDRTQLERLEHSLAAAEKLAAIGTLAAGVAHEVRNPLSSLRGFAQYFVKKLGGKEPDATYARTMMQEADRLNRVITDLLFLARPKEVEPSTVFLPALVDDMEALLGFDAGKKGVTFTRELAQETAWADADAIKQSLLNLLLNSLDAMPPQQELPPCITIASGTEAAGVWLEVRDNGKGMPEEHLRQAFAPFFTAKEHGTGLGLALVQGTMHRHGGDAHITSTPGQGTTVRLLFPHAGTGATTAQQESSATSSPTQNGENQCYF